MTNETAPERIWVETGGYSDRVCEHGEYGGTEYVRADALEAAQARIAELEGALEFITNCFEWGCVETGRQKAISGARAALEGKG